MLAITFLRDPNAPGPTIYVSMIVDSGGNVSLLAKERLRELGIRQRGAHAEIERDRAPALGVRSQFPTWRSKVPVRGQVVLPLEPASAPHASANWTPWDLRSTSSRDSRTTYPDWPAAETSSEASS